jgi:hypothetical protein
MNPSNDSIPATEYRLAERLAREGAALTERNAEFAALSPADQRVAIALDVLKWLASGRLRARSGIYLAERVGLGGWVDKPYKPESNVCHACALGGIFAVAASYDEGIFQQTERWGHRNYQAEGMRNALDGYFDHDQLNLIETAFERSDFTFLPSDDENRINAIGFVRGSAIHRMRKIMRNIVQNHGTFVPGKSR